MFSIFWPEQLVILQQLFFLMHLSMNLHNAIKLNSLPATACHKVMGIVVPSIVYFCLVKPITRSTWILTEYKPRWLLCRLHLAVFPLVKTAHKPTLSPTSKPRSARIKSCGDIFCRKTPMLSYMLIDMVPCGVIPMWYFMGL